MKPLEYLHLQLRLEGMEIVGANMLKQAEFVPGEDVPLMILAQLADRQVVLYHDASLQPGLSTELKTRARIISFPEIDPLLEFIRAQNISIEVGRYKTYLFPEHTIFQACPDVESFSGQHPLVKDFGFGDLAEQVYGIQRDGRLVSACISSHENEQCGEAWVYSDPQYRNQGFAQRVVYAWAQSLIRAGKVPFYSHKLQNTASANLARRLNLQSVFEEIMIAYTSTPIFDSFL